MIDNLQAVIARDEQRQPQDDEYPSDDRAYEENPLLSVVVFKAVGFRHRASEKNTHLAEDAVTAHPVVIHLRSEEHTSELQSRGHLVCRLLLEKKNTRRPI